MLSGIGWEIGVLNRGLVDGDDGGRLVGWARARASKKIDFIVTFSISIVN